MADKVLAEDDRMAVDYRVQVAYTMPVEVIVDLQTGTVEKVVVIGESVALDPEGGARQEAVLHPVPSGVGKQAIDIAESGCWPAWQDGF